MNLNKLHNDIHEGALQLLAEHREQLFAKARMLCASDDEADELVIRTIDQAIRKVNTYAGEGDILAWMKSILVNLHNNDNRSPVVRGTKAVEPGELERCAGADWSTDEQILANSDKDVLMAAINQLDPEYRRLVAMYYFNGLSLREIAVFLNSSTSSVSRKLEVARKILFAKLKTKLGKKPLAVLAAVLTFVSAATAAVATVPALAPVRDAVAAWFAEEDAGGTGVGGTGVPPVQEDVGGTGVPPVQEDVGGTGVPPVQSETVSEPEQEDTTPTQPNTTETTKGETMNIKKIAAVAGATVLGLSAASADTSVDVENPTTSKNTFVWKGTGTTAEENRWSVGANWEGGVAPSADDVGCAISIPAATQGSEINNDIAGLCAGELNVASAASFTLTGEPLALTDVGTFTSTTPNLRCEMPLVLAEGATNVLSIADGLTNTFAADTLRGKGGLRKNDEGTMVLEGDNTFEGDVILYKGFVKMSTASALGVWWKTVRIGPNHKAKEQHTQLNLTKAMNFKYNLEFVRQTGSSSQSNRAQYLVCPGGTQIDGTIRQDVTTAGTCSALFPSSGTMTCNGDVYLTGNLDIRGAVVFKGRVITTATAEGLAETTFFCSSSGGSVSFSVPDNTIDKITLGYGKIYCLAANVLCDNLVFSTEYESGSASIYLNGFDQTCNGFSTSTEHWNKSGAHHPFETPVGKPCRLTVKPTANRTGRFHLNGPLTLVVDSPSSRTQAVVNAESTMTGELIISNGAFKVGYSSPFPYVPGFEIGANGKLIITNGVTVGTGDSDFRLTTGGRLVLENGATFSVKRLCKDGKTVTSAYGKTFCAPGAGVAGAEEADWIEGTGALTVNARVIEDDVRTWTGGAGAGGDNEDMTDPRNWEPGGMAPSLVEGGLFPTFATEGTNAWFAGDLDLNGLVFDATNSFSLTAKDADGTVRLGKDGLSATGAHTYTVDAALEVTLGQDWTAAKGSTLRLARGFTMSDAPMSLRGGGTFVFEGDVTKQGNIDLYESTLTLRDGTFASNTGKLVAQDAATRIRLENAVVLKPLTAFADTSSQLTSVAGTTNVVKSYVTWASETSLSVEKDSQLTFAGGVGSIGWSGFNGAGRDVSTIVVTNDALSGAKISFAKVSVHLWSTGNSGNYGLSVAETARLYLQVQNAMSGSAPFYLSGPVDFCGKNQQCGNLKSSEDTGKFYSATPAVLTVNQAGGEGAGATTFVGHFEGAAGLKKTSTMTLTLNAANPTTGSLEVAGGTLVMGPDATWGGTDVSVTGADAVLQLESANNFGKKTVLNLTKTGAKLRIGAGVNVRMGRMFVANTVRPERLVQVAPGIYTKDTLPQFFTDDSEGTLEVRGGGLMLIVQ